MRICKGALVGLLVLMFSAPALAADIVKMGYFDMQRVIDRSEMGQEGAEKFKAEKEKVREQLAAKVQEIKEMDDEFKKKEPIWSQEMKKSKAQALMSKKMEYERATYEANRQLGQQEQMLLRPIKEKVLEIVARIGKEEGYTMIWEMRRSGLAYAPTSLEITDRVIRELNELAAKETGKGFSFPKQ